jgi:S1-C subfamily serine protease
VIALSLIGALIVIGVAVALTSGGSSNNGNTGTGPTASAPGGYTQRELGLVLQSVPVDRVIVQAVVPGSPADQAGIGASDTLLSVNGHQITSPGQVDNILSHLHQGSTVTLQLDQGPVAMTVGIALAGTNAGP